MKLIYGIEAKPPIGKSLLFAFQQMIAIMAATLLVPMLMSGMKTHDGASLVFDPAAALFGAGIGTLVYVLFTKKKSPVFLGSSFAFIGSMTAAFAGATSIAIGYLGLIIGAALAGLVYVIIALIVRLVGVNWIIRIMPAVVIGPTVAIIGLSLAGNAIQDLQTANAGGSYLIAILCGLVTLITVTLCSTYGRKGARLIPFIIGILAGYCIAAIFTAIGNATGVDALKISNFSSLTALVANGVSVSTFFTVPSFTFLTAFGGFDGITWVYVGTIAMAYVPVAFVVFAEHIADHKNISSIIGRDLLENPGLSRTLLGDGVGSMVGAAFGGCPNTTYGESVACVAITRNASVATIIAAAIGAIIISFLSPFVAFVNSIPSCVMGGVCMALYGFIAVSGLKMMQNVDLNQNKNLFVASTILVAGIGGLALTFGQITITNIATALILGILVNLILSRRDKQQNDEI